MKPIPDSREDGSMLIEVLVAFVILAGAIVIAFQIFGDGLRRLNVVEPKLEAVAVLRAQLAQIVNRPIVSGQRFEGDSGPSATHWLIVLTALDGDQPASTPMRPFRVQAWAGSPGEELAGEPMLETIVLAPLRTQ